MTGCWLLLAARYSTTLVMYTIFFVSPVIFFLSLSRLLLLLLLGLGQLLDADAYIYRIEKFPIIIMPTRMCVAECCQWSTFYYVVRVCAAILFYYVPYMWVSVNPFRYDLQLAAYVWMAEHMFAIWFTKWFSFFFLLSSSRTIHTHTLVHQIVLFYRRRIDNGFRFCFGVSARHSFTAIHKITICSKLLLSNLLLTLKLWKIHMQIVQQPAVDRLEGREGENVAHGT